MPARHQVLVFLAPTSSQCQRRHSADDRGDTGCTDAITNKGLLLRSTLFCRQVVYCGSPDTLVHSARAARIAVPLPLPLVSEQPLWKVLHPAGHGANRYCRNHQQRFANEGAQHAAQRPPTSTLLREHLSTTRSGRRTEKVDIMDIHGLSWHKSQELPRSLVQKPPCFYPAPVRHCSVLPRQLLLRHKRPHHSKRLPMPRRDAGAENSVPVPARRSQASPMRNRSEISCKRKTLRVGRGLGEATRSVLHLESKRTNFPQHLYFC